ncbi:MAG: AAA family ATPase [Planctomycetaceae bacterium]|nr:AAA family ATPase [Planctomycetaceae bacterium]
MYESYWGLSQKPFENDFNADFCYPSQTYQSALLKMLYVIEQGQGAGLLVGGVGCGKSYLISQLAQEIPPGFGPLIHLVFPQMSAEELLGYLAVEMGVNPKNIEGNSGRLDIILRELGTHLQQYVIGGHHPIIVVDEAHTIAEAEVLQSLQLLMNFQQQPQKKFSLILAGERSLLAPVQRLSQLDERISIRCSLSAMTREETQGYITHRLEVAGREKAIFSKDAQDSIFELSGGIPRRINRLCDLSLLVGYAENLPKLTAQEIEAVSDELLTAAAE